jgi:hypothetical protein
MPPSDENARCIRADANDQMDGPWKSAVKAWDFYLPAVRAGARSLVTAKIALRAKHRSPVRIAFAPPIGSL